MVATAKHRLGRTAEAEAGLLAALAYVNQMVALDPKSEFAKLRRLNTLTALARIRAIHGSLPLAAETLRTIEQLHPNWRANQSLAPGIWFAQAMLFETKHNQPAACAAFQTAAKAPPDRFDQPERIRIAQSIKRLRCPAVP
jgi:Tfp pilus assembly protein FimT